jgi:glycine cleavage system H protein
VQFSAPAVFQSYKFAKSHEWAMNKGGIATIGISDHAQGALGDLVFVEVSDQAAGSGPSSRVKT